MALHLPHIHSVPVFYPCLFLQPGPLVGSLLSLPGLQICLPSRDIWELCRRDLPLLNWNWQAPSSILACLWIRVDGDGLCSFFKFKCLQRKGMLSVRGPAGAPLLCLPPPTTYNGCLQGPCESWLGSQRSRNWPLKERLQLASSAYPRSKLNQHLEADPSGASESGWLQTLTSQSI